MPGPSLAARALIGALAIAPSAHAADDAALDAIREEIRNLKAHYEQRISALEKRLEDAEAAAATANAPPPAPAPAAGLAAFNPAISAVLQGVYANLSQDPQRYRLAGFATGSDVGPARRGLHIGESELAFFANVDPLFAANLIVSHGPDGSTSVEEAYGVVTGLENGLAPKFGRFFSGAGYLNEQHAHAWDFVDAPLAYQAFLGGQLALDGAQVKWIAPTERYLELVAEAGSGDGFPGSARNANGVGTWVLGAHTGGDIGESHSWRAGLSWVHAKATDRASTLRDLTQRDGTASFTGHGDTAIADFVWKYAPNGNARQTNFKVQGEYFRRRERGRLAFAADSDTPVDGPYDSVQRGWYLQGVWQFMPQWRVGARYDRLDGGRVRFDSPGTGLADAGFDPQRTAAMLDWTPSEFSRWRLQVARAKVRPEATDTEVFLQYILTIGAHGAHKF